MATPEQLAALLHQIRHTRSPLQRFKLVTLAWRTLRGMSAGERQQLIREIGAEGAERLVEGLARREGLAPASLLTAIHQAETSGSAEPLKTALFGDEGPASAEPAATEEPFGPQPGAATPAATDGDAPFAVTAPPPAAKPPPPAPTPSAPPPEPAPKTPRTAADDAPKKSEQTPTATEPSPPSKPHAQPQRQPRPAPVAPTRRPRQTPAAPDRAEQPSGPPVRPAAERPQLAAAADLLREVAQEPSLMRRLRYLHHQRSAVAELDQTSLRQLVESFPVGWARRRAMEGLLRSGAFRSVDLLVEMLPLLDSATDRLWLLTAAVDFLHLADADEDRLLEAVGDPAANRRLRMRLAGRRQPC